eukprot:7150926-Prymnesium_polylepis.1
MRVGVGDGVAVDRDERLPVCNLATPLVDDAGRAADNRARLLEAMRPGLERSERRQALAQAHAVREEDAVATVEQHFEAHVGSLSLVFQEYQPEPLAHSEAEHPVGPAVVHAHGRVDLAAVAFFRVDAELVHRTIALVHRGVSVEHIHIGQLLVVCESDVARGSAGDEGLDCTRVRGLVLRGPIET